MMLQQRSKKILFYLFIFLMIGTINNKNLNNINLTKINKINVSGLDEKNNLELIRNLNFMKINNLFFLDNFKITKIISSNPLVEKYSVFKKYPSTLNIKIDKTKFLAQLKKDGEDYLLGSNGKFIKASNTKKDIPFIFGNFEIKNFFELKKAIDETNFNYKEIESLFFFKSGRWDIQTNSGVLIKLPKKNLKNSLELAFQILSNNTFKKVKILDIRQSKQVVVNE
jgi:cell division protein FtsQ